MGEGVKSERRGEESKKGEYLFVGWIRYGWKVPVCGYPTYRVVVRGRGVEEILALNAGLCNIINPLHFA